MTERTLAANDVLFEIGDDGETVFVIVEGQFDVVTPTTTGELTVATLGPDDIVGEITAVIGGERTATVRAVTAARVLEMTGDAFEQWLAQGDGRAERLAVEARQRMDRTRVARVVAELVGHENPSLIEEMTDVVEWVTLLAGEPLFAQGDEADAAYILVGGQMQIVAIDPDGAITLDTRVGRGELIGEMGVIESTPRMASVRAIRDCTLARIPKVAFEDLTARYPALMLPLVRKVIARVGGRARQTAHAGMIALLCVTDTPWNSLGAQIVDEIGRFGSALHLDNHRVERFLRRRDIANATRGSAADARLTEFLHEVDVAHQWVVLECDDVESVWSRRALRSADRVVIVASAKPGAQERSRIETARRLLDEIGDCDVWTAQVNPQGLAHPTGTKALRELAGAHRAVHLKQGQDDTVRRLARLASGNGLGVALSGGGARSFGQLGALQVMDELGFEIDAISGTSMGSVIGAFAALVDDIQRSVDKARSEFTGIKLLDYTLPFASLFEGRKMAEQMQRTFGGLDIEDTMIPFTCLSTNLTRAELVEHRSGDLVHAMRASVSLPGVFPPVATADGDLLVDGGVLENLPAGPLQRDPGIGTVLGIDVAPPDGPRARSELGLSLSGVDILKNRVRRNGISHPPLASTVITSMLVGSAQARTSALDNEDIDFYLSLNLSGVKLLDFDALESAISRGYQDSLPELTKWAQSRNT